MTVAVSVCKLPFTTLAFSSAEVRSIYVLESVRRILYSGRPKVVSTLYLQVYEVEGEVEGFINQQQSTISLAAVVEVNRILNLSVPDPFFPTPRKRKKKAVWLRETIKYICWVILNSVHHYSVMYLKMVSSRLAAVSVPELFHPENRGSTARQYIKTSRDFPRRIE